MAQTTTRRPVIRVRLDGAPVSRPDTLAVEDPLQIQVNGTPYAITMRTPGHDLELALGFLLSEGVISSGEQVVRALRCPDDPTGNSVSVHLDPHVPEPVAARARVVSSACGVCGSGSIEDAAARTSVDLRTDQPRFTPEVLASLPAQMRQGQAGFERSGGLHAAALFDAAGQLLCLREDVGRHNAVDKVVGWALTHRLTPLRGCVLQVSGRASFELAQKTWMAGVPVLCAVSAPSSLAVDVAEEAGLTLIGFSRGEGFTIYAGAQRVTPQPEAATPVVD